MYKLEMIFGLFKLHLFLLSSVILSYFQLPTHSSGRRFPPLLAEKEKKKQVILQSSLKVSVPIRITWLASCPLISQRILRKKVIS